MKKLNLILKTTSGHTESVNDVERVEYQMTNMGTFLEVTTETGPYTIRMSEIECVSLAESIAE